MIRTEQRSRTEEGEKETSGFSTSGENNMKLGSKHKKEQVNK